MKNNNKTLVRLVLRNMLVGAAISSVALYGATEINKEKSFQNYYTHIKDIKEQVIGMQLGAVKQSGGLPSDYNIAEGVKAYMQNEDENFIKSAQERVSDEQQTALGMGLSLGAIAGAAATFKKDNKNKRKELADDNELER